jgi:hypothetical protein
MFREVVVGARRGLHAVLPGIAPSMQLFQYRAAAMELLVMFVVLLAVERISTMLRAPDRLNVGPTSAVNRAHDDDVR